MKKKVFVLAAWMAVMSLGLTACQAKGESQTESVSETVAQTETAEETEESQESPEETEDADSPEGDLESQPQEGQSVSDEKLNDIYTAVKEAYKDQYIPSMALDGEMLESIYGIKSDWYEEAIAEGPMISAHVETFMGFKAVPGHEEDIASALYDYRDKQLADGIQYPMNLPKLEAAQVVEEDGYVFFVMLGGADEEAEEQGEEAALESAKKNNQIGVDVIEGFFEE